ncbi:adenylate kinase [Thermospira aquatica]|uniref:Adenylate kinase n=1 Tax=Thermospira aquatica TaxID=2828656 RepID=A0AAX3B9W3_9SPIR|nr:adenylate kinase [Thermospira aquatica]URA09058.1 adenylate kinase [Thermospira aquatica]
MLRVALIAPPGGGKGTQAAMMKEHFGLVHIATGDIFRAIVRGEYKGNMDVEMIKGYMARGELIPDQVVIDLVVERISQPDCAKGYLMDGFPRTVEQAKAFDAIDPSKRLTHVLYLRVPREVILDRLLGRWTCPTCQAVYHEKTHPPKVAGICDVDGTALIQREDDKEETILKRLDIYEKQTMPLISYYRDAKILTEIDGNATIYDVFSQIKEVLSA